MDKLLRTASTLGGLAAVAGVVSEYCLYDGK
jgi:hypothetical protein